MIPKMLSSDSPNRTNINVQHANPQRRMALKATLIGSLMGVSLAHIPSLWAKEAITSTTTISAQDREALIQALANDSKLDAQWIRPFIMQAKYDNSIITRMQQPYESRPYAKYRPLFVHQTLATKGNNYMQEHATIFEHAFQRYGVQKEIITAILGMETRFGQHRGKDLVVDSLFTLSTGYPRRAKFFRHELAELLLLCHEENLNPSEFKGSYAGAFGTTQFIPSSYRAYAVDADHDGKRDVWHSPSDIIHSVANYFHKHGWNANNPIAYWLPFTKELKKQADIGMKDWTSLGDLRQHSNVLQHTQLPALWKNHAKVSVIQMETRQGMQMALIDYNFYVISRWNRSYNYAMAVTELADLLGCNVCQTA